MLIYLSGKMTGLPNFGAEIFARYAEKYRAEGFTVLSPPEMDREVGLNKDYTFYIKRDVAVLLGENVERVYMLPNWHSSRGAKLEKHIAEMFGIAIYDADTGEPYIETVTQEANRLVHGDRGAIYSHPLDDFGRTAKMVSAILGVPVSEEQVALIMIAVKASRLTNSPDHRDSVVDIAGYAECYWMVREERERRALSLGNT